MSVLAREPRVQIDTWEDLKAIAKKVDLLGVNKAKAKQVVQELYGIKLRGSQAISRIIIDFDIIKASGKEAMEEFFGEATEGEAYEHKLLEFYATNGVKAVYVTV